MIMAGTNSLVIQDILPPYTNNKKVKFNKITLDMWSPLIIFPVLMVISCLSKVVTIITMVGIAMGLLYMYSKPQQKYRSRFFYSWILASSIWLLYIFEIHIMLLLEVTQLENMLFVILLAITFLCFYQVKTIADSELRPKSPRGHEESLMLTSDSYYCHTCQIEVKERYFHSMWLDCCIFRPNYLYYVAGLIFGLLTLLVSSNFGLTSVCHPYISYGGILMPKDCSYVYFNFSNALAFVGCVYALCYGLVIIAALLQQIFVYIPRYSGQQWKRLVNILEV